MINRLFANCCKKRHITSFFLGVHPSLFISRNSSVKTSLKMNEAFLRYSQGSETFDFTFRYSNPELNLDRRFNLSRKTNETVQEFLQRIDTNVGKFLNKKKKKRAAKKPQEEIVKPINNVEQGNIVLLKQGTKVSLDEPCTTILEDPTKLSMVILGVPYDIKFNAPWIISVNLPTSILAGFPVYPVQFEALYIDKIKSIFTWFKSNVSDPKNPWTEVGNGYLYIPSSKDIGSRLKLRCVPRNDTLEGPEMEVESAQYVEAGPGVCPFELRHLFTQTKLSDDNFRITSYNILADTYADSDYSREVLFPYCPPYALAIDYRKLLIIKELLGYNSDIICLQEVDKKIYANDLLPSLSLSSYDGIYDSKGEMSEGLVIFYDKKRFELLDNQKFVMSESIDCNDEFKEIWEKITNENAKKRFLDRNTSLMIVTLRSIDKPSEILVIGNTHLYFHPDADHIRLLQAYFALTACRKIAAQIREKFPNDNVTVMLCGDFNSTPPDAVYQLMTTNLVPENHKDWSSNAEQKIENTSLTHDLSLASACGTPEYTNFTVEFADCLDYIFYEKNKLEVTQVIPMPSKEELSLHSAIPSVVFPSDHIAICADLKWIS